MSNLTAEEIPGFQAALDREQNLRNLAMDGQVIPLCGRLVRQLTLRHVVRLSGCENHFITGGTLDPAEVAVFLWIVSPQYCLDPAKRDAFYQAALRLDFQKAFREINAYLDDALWDCDSGGGDPRVLVKSYYSYAARLVSFLALHFHWDDDAILDKPIARLFQYERVIQKRAGLPISNRTDGLLGKWLAARTPAN